MGSLRGIRAASPAALAFSPHAKNLAQDARRNTRAMSLREVAAVFGAAMFTFTGVLSIVQWRDPRSKWFVAFSRQFTTRFQGDGLTRAAASNWGGLGVALISPATVYWMMGLHFLPEPVELVLGYAFGVSMLGCFAAALWVRFGNAPQRLRPAALRETSAEA
jgi:hypothetical protein